MVPLQTELLIKRRLELGGMRLRVRVRLPNYDLKDILRPILIENGWLSRRSFTHHCDRLLELLQRRIFMFLYLCLWMSRYLSMEESATTKSCVEKVSLEVSDVEVPTMEEVVEEVGHVVMEGS